MKHIASSQAFVLTIGCVFMLWVAGAMADITVNEQYSVRGEGVMGFANMTGTSTTAIAGDKSSTRGEVKLESRLTRMFAGDLGDTAQIVRLDQDTLYQLDMKERTYTELSLAEQRAQIEQAMQQARDAQQQQPTAMDESQCDWSEPVTEVTRGGTEKIAGYDAEQLRIAASQACTDRETGQVCEFSISLEQWLAPEFSGEAAEFYRAYAEQMGFEVDGSGAFAQRAEALLGKYSGLWSEIAEKTGDVEGYPLKSEFALAVGGPQCEQAQQAPGITAADVGESVGGLGGRLAGSLFGRKKKDEPAAAAAADSAMMRLLTVSSEITAVSTGTVDPETFEVPADFTRTNGGN